MKNKNFLDVIQSRPWITLVKYFRFRRMNIFNNVIMKLSNSGKTLDFKWCYISTSEQQRTKHLVTIHLRVRGWKWQRSTLLIVWISLLPSVTSLARFKYHHVIASRSSLPHSEYRGCVSLLQSVHAKRTSLSEVLLVWADCKHIAFTMSSAQMTSGFKIRKMRNSEVCAIGKLCSSQNI